MTFLQSGVMLRYFSSFTEQGVSLQALNVFSPVALIQEIALPMHISLVCDFSFCFCFFWSRIVELFSPGSISPHWGILSKCLAYSKAASDPFVYSLLRHQYRKTCGFLVNKALKRSPLNSSSLRIESKAGRNTNNYNSTSHTQSSLSKPLNPWRHSHPETFRTFATSQIPYFCVHSHENWLKAAERSLPNGVTLNQTLLLLSFLLEKKWLKRFCIYFCILQ